ncbi:MAG: hypothetical protein KA318_00040 [Nitrosomonas sp.]|nr:hypothetical protein [Nitrosomonas sp.]
MTQGFTQANSAVSQISGTFVPVLAFGGASVGITYSVQLGQYTKTGDVVTFMVTIAITSKGSSTGVATITGFPYASRASSIHYFTTAQGAVTYTGEIITQMGGSATSVSLLSLATGTDATALTNSSFANTSVYRFCGSYLI